MANQRKAVEKHKADLEELIELAERGRVNRFVERGYVLQELPRGRKRYVFASREDKAKLLASLKARMADAANPVHLLPVFDEEYPKGHVGMLPTDSESYRVLQVVDERNVLVDVLRPQRVSAGTGRNAALEKGSRAAYRAQRGISGLTINLRSHTLWIQVDTNGLTDGSAVDLSGRLFCSLGTKTYQTAAGGSKTVPLLKAIDVPDTRRTRPPTAAHAPGRSSR